jgi:cytochrome c oxidase subunit 2
MISSLFAKLSADNALPKSPPSDDFWMPTSASTFAPEVDGLYNFLFWLSAVSAAGIFIAMLYFAIKYKAKSREANEVPEDSPHHSTALEITWSVIPLFICIGIFVWGFKGFVEMRTPPKDTIEIHAQGQKWNWIFTYSTGKVDSKMHVPVDKDVRVIIQSVDVLHSLFIPAFRTKMDAVPGRYTDLWFRATKTGTYPIFCAEYCGTSHSDMLSEAVVHEAGAFEQWVNKIEVPSDPKVWGEQLYVQRGCKTCHSVDGTALVGPSWQGLFGKDRKFTDGSQTTADENYISNSINNPAGQVVEGFVPSMPSYQGQLSDKEINAIVEYIKSLK